MTMPRKEYLGRCQMLYYRSEKEGESWRQSAKEVGEPTSKYILEMAELGRSKRDRPRGDPTEAAQLHKELRILRDKIEVLEMLREKNEAEIMKLRHRIFLEPDHDGSHIYSSRILDLLRHGGIWPGHELLKALHIPAEDSEAVDIIVAQLRGLEGYGLVRESIGGWQWIA
jgi:hypothetical protein